jgi:DNA-binding transcriptional regulator/RsmH inhibitor MraZ
MQLKIVWQSGINNQENTDNLHSISQWWTNLNGKEIVWVERMIPQIGGMSEIHWQPQRFDETFMIVNPEIRTDTLYWQKPDSALERNSTVQKLELDNLQQQLYLYPQLEPDMVIRIGIPEVKYQTLEIKNVEIALGEDNIMLLWDPEQELEIKIALSSENIVKLKELLAEKQPHI